MQGKRNVPYFRRNSVAHTSETHLPLVWQQDQHHACYKNNITTKERNQQIPQSAVPVKEMGMLGLFAALQLPFLARKPSPYTLAFNSDVPNMVYPNNVVHNILQKRINHLESKSHNHRMMRRALCTC
jgi:hypothetical protein